MSDNRIPMTPEGHAALRTELRRLKTEDRRQVVREIEKARAHGDLSENAEYHAAKEKQGHIEGRIVYLEDRLSRAQVIDGNGQDTERVTFGAFVQLEDSDSGKEIVYRIVGEDEADVAKGMISVTSPVARALMGKEVDSTVKVKVPSGEREFEIMDIRFEP